MVVALSRPPRIWISHGFALKRVSICGRETKRFLGHDAEIDEFQLANCF